MLQYTGGSNYMCNGQDRSLRLHLFCANNPHTLPNEASVVEYPMCTYNIEMQTQFACPISCGEINRKLCGGYGVCGYDRDMQRARCFCNDGHYGTACEKDGTGRSEVSSSSYILLCVCGFLFIVEIGV